MANEREAREPGFYWVTDMGGSEGPAYWAGARWRTIGTDTEYDADVFDKIGPRILPPTTEPPDTAWMVKWLEAAAKQFEKAGAESSEDMAHWAGVHNAENARKIAAYLTGIEPPTAPAQPQAERTVPRQWMAVMADIVARFDVAATFGMSTTWNAEGSRSLAVLIRQMCSIIDNEIDHRQFRLLPPTPATIQGEVSE